MNYTRIRQDQLLDHLETIVFVQADIRFILGIEITGELLDIKPGDHRADQPACNPLFLECRVNADKKKVVVGKRSMFFMQSVDSGRKRHDPIHNLFPQAFLQQDSS